MSDHTCSCGARIDVFYTDPLIYTCSNKECAKAYRDQKDVGERMFGARVLSKAQAEGKRPAMYGLPQCSEQDKFGKYPCCGHAPHEPGQCTFCNETASDRVVQLVEVPVQWRKLRV